MAQSSVPEWKYDVFLSFRGDDTRKGIVSHLYHELQNMGGIKTFKDEEGLEIGAPISPSLLRAIEESRFGIVILSSNYASSAWCLDELVHIVLCMEGKDRILPIFYDVDPSEVRHQRGSFRAALATHEENSHDHKKVEKWRVALEKVASLAGWHTNNFRSDRELVKRIVESVCSKVHDVPPFAIDESSKDIKNKPFSFGPYGSNKGGKEFDDGAYSTVRQLVLHWDAIATSIKCIQVEYDMDGTSVWSDKHGDPDPVGCEKVTVKLDYPTEFLTSIHGFHSDIWFLPTEIISLTFKSNKKTYGPFGGKADCRSKHFSIEVPGTKIVGFHGRSNNHLSMLRAIGAHLKPLPIISSPKNTFTSKIGWELKWVRRLWICISLFYCFWSVGSILSPRLLAHI